MSPLAIAGGAVAGYLLGSIPTGLLVSRLRGVDIRRIGSGNIGATNVARALGKRLGVVVLLLDAGKGLTPTLLAQDAWRDLPHGPAAIALVGLCAILGHVFTPWLGFRGGKGVATALGVFLALSPLAALAAFVVYAAAYAAWRISSLGSICGATSLVAAMFAADAPGPFVGLAALAWLLIMVTHRANIRRLLKGEEGKL